MTSLGVKLPRGARKRIDSTRLRRRRTGSRGARSLPEIYEAYLSNFCTSIRSFVISELGLEVPLELELAVLVLELKSFSGLLDYKNSSYAV